MEAIQALIERLDKVSEEANVNAVFGEPRTVEGRVLIPVAEVMYGFGMGAGSMPKGECDCDCEGACECSEETVEECCDETADEACCAGAADEACCEEGTCECEAGDEPADGVGEGAGGGAGARVRPIAYIEVGPEGTHVKPIVDEQKVALAGILLGAWAVGWVGLVLKTLFTRRS